MRRGLRSFFGEKAVYENTALHGAEYSPEDISFTTVVDLSWQPEMGFTLGTDWGGNFQEDKFSPNLKYNCGG